VPIKTVQKRLTQVGVIRLGEQRTSQRGKKYPARLETLRFTSPSRNLIEAVAAAYGGEVKPWQGNRSPEWEVITATKEVPVLVPPQKIDPNMEHWGPGFRDRLCDGEAERMRQAPCLCAAAIEAGKPFGQRDVCKPTTRMSLMLADIPSLGTWKLEARGWNAAAELPGLDASIENAPFPVPGRLVVSVREKKDFDPSKSGDDAIESKVYVVPEVLFDWLTPAQAFGGELGAAARAALGAASIQRHAIEAAKVEDARPKMTAEEYGSAAEDAAEVEDVRGLWTLANRDGVLTEALAALLTARVAALTGGDGKPKPTAEAPTPAPVEPPPADDVVDVEVEPNADEVWSRIQPIAGELGWSTKELEQRVEKFLGKSSGEADGFELTRFLGALGAGEVE
jgi:hypothetical protein